MIGVDFTVMHLDGRMIRIVSKQGEVLKPDTIKTISNIGMPVYETNKMFGNLFIHFKVCFPDFMNTKYYDLLKTIFSDKDKK